MCTRLIRDTTAPGFECLPFVTLLAILVTFSSPLSAREMKPQLDLPSSKQRLVISIVSIQDVQNQLQKANAFKLAGNLEAAENAARKALAAAQSLLRKRDIAVTTAQATLGKILIDSGQYTEGEDLLRRSLAATEARNGPGHESSTTMLHALGLLYLRQGRYAEARGALEAALKIQERVHGRKSELTAEVLNSLASVYYSLGDMQAALNANRRVYDIAKSGGARTGDFVAAAANNLAAILAHMGKNDEAIEAYKKAYDANVSFFGPDNPAPITNLMNLGVLYRNIGNYAAAEPLLTAVLDYKERTLGPDHFETAHSENNMGWLELAKEQPQAALPYFRNAVAGYQRFRDHQVHGMRGQGGSINEREVGRSILGLLKALSQSPVQSKEELFSRIDEGFQAAQRVHTNAASVALARAGARFASGDGQLADLLRQGQNLALEWRKIDDLLTQALSEPSKRRNASRERAAGEEQKSVGLKLDAIEATILERFPEYASLVDPRPIAIKDVQGLLNANEALVLVTSFGLGNGDGTFVWFITKDEALASGSTRSIESLADLVSTLRCGLDIGAWSSARGSSDCTARTGGKDSLGLPRFDAKLAYGLYGELFGNFEHLIGGKTLIVITSDPLASLPFQVLVKKQPSVDFPDGMLAMREIAWLGRDNPISIIPSVNSLKILRNNKVQEQAPDAYVGFGDPVLSGNLDCPPSDVQTACPDPSKANTISQDVAARSTPSGSLINLFKNGIVDIDAVRSLCPLPDTATELRCVASSLGAPSSSVHVAENATKAAVTETDLSRYRIVHFATHGLVAGDLDSADGALSEPALVMTPPAEPTPDDDGLLKASDIVGLKLNADWVIMSACNTASAQGYGGEALSGLASSFLYAGARALLASHWPVRSDAAVRLTTFAMAELAKHPGVGRAEAMRRSMVNILDHGGQFDSHPMVWAPFSIIGEAGTSRN